MSAEGLQLRNCRSVPETSGDAGKEKVKAAEHPPGKSPRNGESKRRKPTRLCSFPAREVAEEMTLMDANLLRLIKASELEDGAWMKKDKEEKAPNIMAMVKAFNKVALLVPTEILEETTPQARAKVILTYIKVAQECYCHGNYNSLKAVLAGLQCTPIFRLAKTWKEISSRKRKKFEELSKVMHEDNNWSAYREEVSKKLRKNKHFIPFLGIFLTTTAFSQSAAAVTRRETGLSTASKEHLDVDERRMSTDSMYETYHLLEAITVREKLDKLRRSSITLSPGQQPENPGDTDQPDSSLIMSPPPTENGHFSLLGESPTTSIDDITACRSCVELGSMPSSAITCKDSLISSTASSQNTIQFTTPVDDLSPPYSHRNRNHLSSSEGNVKAVLGVARRFHAPSSVSANTSPAHNNVRRNLESSFEDVTDSAPVRGKKSRLESSSLSGRHKGKKMRVSKGITKTAKFFAMLRNRYRNGISSTVGSGLGDVVMDRNLNSAGLSPKRSHSMKHTRASTDTENAALKSGRRLSGRGLLRSSSQHDALTLHTRGSVTPREIPVRKTEGGLNPVLSGSLEGLLTAVNTRLSGEWSQASHSEVEKDEGKAEMSPTHPKLCRSPSMFGLASFECDDVADGNSVSLTSSFSSPSLKSLMESSRTSSATTTATITTTTTGDAGHVPSLELESPSGVKKTVRGVDVSEKGPEVEENRRKQQQRESVGDSLSRTPSSSSMDSAGSSPSAQSHLPTLRLHRRNSSDPNYFSGNSPRSSPIAASRHLSKITPPTSSSSPFNAKRSSPLIRAITRESPGMPRFSQARRGGQYSSMTILDKEENLSPVDLLHQYQFLSLGCCYLIQSRPKIREMLTTDSHNSEALNYKLSYIREPD